MNYATCDNHTQLLVHHDQMKNKTGWSTYSFRVECFIDLILLFQNFRFVHQNIERVLVIGEGVEITTILSFRELAEHLANVVDGHVMMGTLRAVPLSQNSLDRRLSVTKCQSLFEPETEEEIAGDSGH